MNELKVDKNMKKLYNILQNWWKKTIILYLYFYEFSIWAKFKIFKNSNFSPKFLHLRYNSKIDILLINKRYSNLINDLKN